MLRYIREGRIKVDRSKNNISATFHDSCNNGRSCGMFEEPRELLQMVVTDFREMYPNRAENYCCTGGGGAMSMSEYAPLRLKSAKIKADQLKATGAKVVVTSCHNCVDGLTDLIKHYKLDMKVTQLVNLVADALVPEECKVHVDMKAKAPDHIFAGKTILVVDDEADIRMTLATMLEDNGATVIQAADGDEALTMARQHMPDLITLDLSMPGKSGVDAFIALREDPALQHLAVCVITGKPEMRKLIYERPVPPPEGFMNKPVDEENLVLNLRKIFELKGKIHGV
jgi:CheY-like chemotaxis protein